MRRVKRATGTKRQPGGRLGLAAILALVVMIGQAPLAYSPWAVASTSRMDLIHRQRELEAKKDAARARLRQTKVRQRAAGYELKVATNRLLRVRRELIHTTHQLQSTRSELDLTTRNLEKARARLNSHRDAMSSRLVAMYEIGPVQYLDVLMGAANFSDFANRLHLVQLVVDEDLGLMRAFAEERQRVETYRQQVQARERAVSALEVQVARKHDECAESRLHKARVLTSLARQRNYWERALAQMEADSRSIAAQIRRYQRSSGRARWATPWRGSFMQPVNGGGVTSGFGWRMHPILHERRFHTGVDIRAATGTPIHAADGGTVIWAARRGGYGNCVIIDHGGGMSTVYGHCSRLACRAGEEVRKGEVIGYVGSTGLSTGPHLHFEVRRNGTPVNPFTY